MVLRLELGVSVLELIEQLMNTLAEIRQNIASNFKTFFFFVAYNLYALTEKSKIPMPKIK